MINLPKNVLGAFRGRKEMYGKGQDDPFTKGNGGYRHVYGNTWRMEEEKWKILILKKKKYFFNLKVETDE